MVAVIMAGGKGTRIQEINSEIPKPMISVLGKPILQYQIEALARQGVKDVVLVIGHLGHVIKNYFADGKNFGIRIKYIEESEPLGTAGALYLLKEEISDDFLLLCGDLIFDIDIKKFYAAHKKYGGKVTLFTHPNSHPYDSGIIVADENGKVTDWLHKEDKRLWYRNRVNAGLHFMSHRILDSFTELRKLDLDRDVLKLLIPKGEMYVYDSPEYVKDMGTPERYYSVIEDIQSGKVSAKNLTNKQKAIFLDRDGTINEYVGFLRNINDFKLLDGVAEAIKRVNESGYLAIVVSNQLSLLAVKSVFRNCAKFIIKWKRFWGRKVLISMGYITVPTILIKVMRANGRNTKSIATAESLNQECYCGRRNALILT